ncbi:MAG: MauE/DoxX family redox-associated membrane protein [Acidimicrobiia bacterium]
MSSVALAARLVTAVVLAVAALAKLRDRSLLSGEMRAFGVPARVATGAGVGLVLVELAVAAALVLAPGSAGPAWAAVVLLGVFTAAIVVNLARGHRAPCPCFGAGAAPISPRTVLRNGWLLAVAVLGTGSTSGASAGPVVAAAAGFGAVTVVVLRFTP